MTVPEYSFENLAERFPKGLERVCDHPSHNDPKGCGNPNCWKYSRSPGNGALPKCDRALLTVVVQNHPSPVARRKIALCSGYSVRSSGFSNALSSLRVKGYIQGSDPITCTPAGIGALGAYERLPEGRDAIRYWIGQLDKCPSTLLSCLFNRSPLTRKELAEASGYSLTSSGFSNGLSELRTRELITGKDRIEILL